jgi:hypothetical protein
MIEWWIDRLWDGGPADPAERVRLVLDTSPGGLTLEIEAPDHADPAPPTPPGPTPGLWDYEVVELFLVGENERYLEVEVGPGGHHWVAELAGPRHVTRSQLPLHLDVERAAGRWRAAAQLPRAWLPAGLQFGNAYAIHGVGAGRRYLAWHPVPGEVPDFHRIELFPRLPDSLTARG